MEVDTFRENCPLTLGGARIERMRNTREAQALLSEFVARLRREATNLPNVMSTSRVGLQERRL